MFTKKKKKNNKKQQQRRNKENTSNATGPTACARCGGGVIHLPLLDRIDDDDLDTDARVDELKSLSTLGARHTRGRQGYVPRRRTNVHRRRRRCTYDTTTTTMRLQRDTPARRWRISRVHSFSRYARANRYRSKRVDRYSIAGRTRHDPMSTVRNVCAWARARGATTGIRRIIIN